MVAVGPKLNMLLDSDLRALTVDAGHFEVTALGRKGDESDRTAGRT